MKKNVLIIDDNPLNGEDYVYPLEEDYNVIFTMSINEAERKIELYKFDLIVIDIMMPTQGLKKKDELKTGLYFYYERLRLLKNLDQLHFLFWSNLTQDTFDEFFKDAKPKNVDFVHKSMRNPNHLYEKVHSIIG